MRRAATLACGLLACAGPERLAPPPAPGRAVPLHAPGAGPAPGQGRVVLDSVDGPAEVDALEESAFGFDVGRPVCTTPCAADLPQGTYRLRFTLISDDDRVSSEAVTFGPAPSVYRYAVGRHERHWLRAVLGWPLAIDGVALTALSVGATAAGNVEPATGAALSIFSLALTLFGVWLIDSAGGVEQPGAGVQFPLSP